MSELNEEFFKEEDSIEDLLNKPAEASEAKKPEEVSEVAEEESKEQPVESKYLGLFEDEVEALATIRHLSEKAQKADELERQAREQEQRKASETEVDRINREATEHWRRLVEAGKGDEAFQFMQEHTLRQSAMIADAMINDKLSGIAKFHEGKQAFLKDSSVADVHENVEQIAGLIQQGWSEQQAVAFVRSIKGSGATSTKQLDKQKVADAKRKTRDTSYMDESTSGKSKIETGKETEDKLVDSILATLGI